MEPMLGEELKIRINSALLDMIKRTAIREQRSLSNTTRRLIEAGLAAKQSEGAAAPVSKATEYQPHPKRGGGTVVVDVVLADIMERAKAGKQKYGTYLETNNGRDPLWDAYQEAIDLVMYLRQALLERECGASDEPAIP